MWRKWRSFWKKTAELLLSVAVLRVPPSPACRKYAKAREIRRLARKDRAGGRGIFRMPPPGFWPCRYQADEKPFRRTALLPYLRRLDLDCGKRDGPRTRFPLDFLLGASAFRTMRIAKFHIAIAAWEQLGGAKKAPGEGPFFWKFFAQAICRFQSPSRRARSGLPLQRALQ